VGAATGRQQGRVVDPAVACSEAPLTETVLANGVMALGAAVHGTIGFGVALVAAPLLVLLDPALVPAPLITAGVGLNLLVWYRERDAVTAGAFRWPVVGQLAGTLVALVVLELVSPQSISRLIGGVVLMAVVLSLLGLHIAPSSRNLIAAGTLSGFMGTTSAIPGPPLAIVHQHVAGRRLRATLAPFFLVGASLSLAGLALAGRLGAAELMAGVRLLPGVLLGFMVSGGLAPRVNRAVLRYVVLLLSATAAIVVMLRV